MPLEVAQTAPAAIVIMHRACDECRSRKLACTKEPVGCSRCRRESLVCHYSPRKTMGRPRKRLQVEEEVANAVKEDNVLPEQSIYSRNAINTSSTLIVDESAIIPSPSSLVDPMLAFFDETSSPLHLDFGNGFYSSYNDLYENIDPQVLLSDDQSFDQADLSLAFLDEAFHFGDPKFSDPEPSVAGLSNDLSTSLWQHCFNHSPSSSESSEATSSSASTSIAPKATLSSNQDPRITPSDPKPAPSISCGCFSSLYLTLDSLSRLPKDASSAMRVTRQSIKVAHDVIECSYCSGPLIDDLTKPPPIQAFQNTMCLAALVPSACNAYAIILEMVDKETQRARNESRQIWFSFHDIGGPWHTIGENGGISPNIRACNNQHLSPDQWRTIMRAILRLDVTGLGERTSSLLTPGYNYRGLKDVVRLLEERSTIRHARLDELVAQGKAQNLHGHLFPGAYKSVPPEQRGCMKVLEAARVALGNLVIA